MTCSFCALFMLGSRVCRYISREMFYFAIKKEIEVEFLLVWKIEIDQFNINWCISLKNCRFRTHWLFSQLSKFAHVFIQVKKA